MRRCSLLNHPELGSGGAVSWAPLRPGITLFGGAAPAKCFEIIAARSLSLLGEGRVGPADEPAGGGQPGHGGLTWARRAKHVGAWSRLAWVSAGLVHGDQSGRGGSAPALAPLIPAWLADGVRAGKGGAWSPPHNQFPGHLASFPSEFTAAGLSSECSQSPLRAPLPLPPRRYNSSVIKFRA